MKSHLSRTTFTVLATGLLAVTAACGGSSSSFGGNSAPSSGTNGTGTLNVLIGSSGTAETNAVKAAAASFTKQSGVKVTVTAAQNLTQQVSQGMAANTPPDVFYLDTSSFQNYAKSGAAISLWRQGQQPERFLPGADVGLHLQQPVLLRTQGLVHARPGG
jgi:multiple sugar transport system substrate-binding protein